MTCNSLHALRAGVIPLHGGEEGGVGEFPMAPEISCAFSASQFFFALILNFFKGKIKPQKERGDLN